MRYLMDNLYRENYCRFCLDLFCCEKCRLKHEKRVHNLVINCNICIYGKMYYKNVSNELLEHIKLEHLPAICLRCNKKFCDLSELTENHKCTPLYDSPISRHTESMIISGNMDTKFGNNNCALNLPVPNALVTSTPVGISEVNEIGINTLPLSSPPVDTTSEDTSVKINNNITPVENQLQVNGCNSQLFPLVTPLRSIIAKSKSQCNFGENKRKVKFFDGDFASADDPADLKSMKTQTDTNEGKYSKNVYFPYEDVSLSTPVNCEPEEFYTPQNHTYGTPSKPKEYEIDNPAVGLEKNSCENINTTSGIGQFWASMASAFKQIFFHPPSNAICETSDLYYADSSKSTKRNLSPNTQTPNIKRFCTRGHKSDSRLHNDSHP